MIDHAARIQVGKTARNRRCLRFGGGNVVIVSRV